MDPSAASPLIQAREGRFARLEAIQWWDQPRLHRAKVLVVGAGALGNEIVKNLALLGTGYVAIADMDRVELSNLSRSVLFRERDEGLSKAECAARAARDIYPGMRVKAIDGNVLADIGLGWFRWADVVMGALDNREARVFVNSACARVGRSWFDGGIEVLHGVVRGFAPPSTACYECTMSQVDWDLLNKRRSCSLLARRALAQHGTPTTPTTASIVAALQVAEAIKHLHGMRALLGRGLVFDGANHASYPVQYPISPDCPWHEMPSAIETCAVFNSGTVLEAIWNVAAHRLGGLDALDLSRELVDRLECPGCARSQTILQPIEKVLQEDALCPVCRVECIPSFLHSVPPESQLLQKTVRELGLPPWDVIWGRRGADYLGFEIAGDNPWPGEPEVLTDKER